MVARRRLLQALTLAGGFRAAAGADEPKLSLDVLRDVSSLHGTNLSDARLETIRPALEHRLNELRDFRAFEIDDTTGPGKP
jgi:hypothetical protein